MSGIAERWKVLSGSDNWEGLLHPLDSDLRRYLIHYAAMVAPLGDAFINEPASKYVGLSRYARENLLKNTGLVNDGNPFKYEVTKYFYYGTSGSSIGATGYTVTPARADVVLKEANWIGYVAVATDEGKVGLGRRDILVVWRGTILRLEWHTDAICDQVNAPLIFGQNSDPLVHKGWYEMYTTTFLDSKLNETNARDQTREEVARLVELYKDEEVSITVTGHSLGSSMATLNAVDLAANPINNNNNKDIPITAFLYASPKVGNEKFEKAFSNQQNLRALRISDVSDFVPRLPVDLILPLLIYRHVGVELDIDSKKSSYLKPDENLYKKNYHDLMLYMHGIDLYEVGEGKFGRQEYFDLAQVNKYQDALNDEWHIPTGWFNIKYKGMVQQDDGNYILDDHEKDDTFCMCV